MLHGCPQRPLLFCCPCVLQASRRSGAWKTRACHMRCSPDKPSSSQCWETLPDIRVDGRVLPCCTKCVTSPCSGVTCSQQRPVMPVMQDTGETICKLAHQLHHRPCHPCWQLHSCAVVSRPCCQPLASLVKLCFLNLYCVAGAGYGEAVQAAQSHNSSELSW